MPETAQQYIQRILANAQGQDPIKLQSATNRKLTRLVKGVSTPNSASGPRPISGRLRKSWPTSPTLKS